MQDTFKAYKDLQHGDRTPMWKVLARVYKPEEGYVKLLVLWSDVGWEHDQEIVCWDPEYRVKVLAA